MIPSQSCICVQVYVCVHTCVLAGFMPRKEAMGKIWWKCFSFLLEFWWGFFFSHPGITNKISSVLYTVLCTVMPLLPPWLLLKHLTTVIVLYINCTPWWLPYYLFFFSKMVIADISSLITRFINNFNTVSGLIWKVGWWCWQWWSWVSVVLWFSQQLQCLEEIRIQSELHLDNPWDGDSWAAENH